LTSCALPKNALTQRGRASLASQPPALAIIEIRKNSTPISRKPVVKPRIGEVIIGTITFHSTPALFHTGSAGCDQMIAAKSLLAAASAAPTRPPISACDEEDGRPSHQVIRF